MCKRLGKPYSYVQGLVTVAILYCTIAVSVSCLQWFNEEKRFAIGYSDGQVWLLHRDGYSTSPETKISAHEVSGLSYWLIVLKFSYGSSIG